MSNEGRLQNACDAPNGANAPNAPKSHVPRYLARYQWPTTASSCGEKSKVRDLDDLTFVLRPPPWTSLCS